MKYYEELGGLTLLLRVIFHGGLGQMSNPSLVVIGSDHAGFQLKQNLISALRAAGSQVLDVGTHSTRPVDYPDYAEAVSLHLIEQIAAGHTDAKGILICGSGVGASIAANKIPGIRAGLCHDTYSAHQGVEHDEMNVLVLGARVIGTELAHDLCSSFLNARFDGVSRHAKRVKKIDKLESKYFSLSFKTTISRRAS
jgi:RpiB/LacA/LacB family sugar-phosphate isomerase